jgi:hypothetical protein
MSRSSRRDPASAAAVEASFAAALAEATEKAAQPPIAEQSADDVHVKRERWDAADAADVQAHEVRVKREKKAQRQRDADAGIEVTSELVNLTDDLPAHLPADWASRTCQQRQAWTYDWHQENAGRRMCPECHYSMAVKYTLTLTRKGHPKFTCNSISCRNEACMAEFCLECGETKAGGRNSGYHVACGRQPSWLEALARQQVKWPDLAAANADPRVQMPPPRLKRIEDVMDVLRRGGEWRSFGILDLKESDGRESNFYPSVSLKVSVGTDGQPRGLFTHDGTDDYGYVHCDGACTFEQLESDPQTCSLQLEGRACGWPSTYAGWRMGCTLSTGEWCDDPERPSSPGCRTELMIATAGDSYKYHIYDDLERRFEGFTEKYRDDLVVLVADDGVWGNGGQFDGNYDFVRYAYFRKVTAATASLWSPPESGDSSDS